ncbi:DUF4886 domain-containing protein [candidate division KSB1 bacterium]
MTVLIKNITIKLIPVICAVTLLFFLDCTDSSVQPSYYDLEGRDDLKILLIGASYFELYDVPEKLFELAASTGKTIQIERAIESGMFLDDLCNAGFVIEAIKEDRWDFVVFHGAGVPAAYPDTHHNITPIYDYHPLFESLKTLANRIKNNHSETVPVYMMNWAFEDGMTWIPGQTDTFEDMQLKIYNNTINWAQQLDLTIAPVGWAWNKVVNERNDIKLFLSDYNHQNNAGAYLIACVIYDVIFGQPLLEAKFTAGMSSSIGYYLQRTANSIVFENLKLWNIKY